MWFGTNHGISSYNLKKFRNWGIKEGLPDDLTTKILFDRKGKMLVLTLNNGIYYFNEEKQYFFEAGFNPELKKIIKTKFISQIVIDETNKIWFVIRHDEIYSITNNKIKLECNLVKLPHNFGFIVFNISSNLRLYCNLVSDNLKPQPIKLDKLNSQIQVLYYDKPINIVGPVGIKLKNGDELICYKNDLIRYRNNKIITRFNIGNAFVMRVYEDSNHNIWLCTQVGGLIKFIDGVFDKIHCQQFFVGQNISNLFIDNNENLWVGTVGIGAYLISHSQIIRFMSESKVKDLAIINNVLYAGCESGKLFLFDNNNFNEIFYDNRMEIRQVVEYKNKPLIFYSTFSDKVKLNKNFPALVARSGVIVSDRPYSVVYTLMEHSNDLKEHKEIILPAKTSCILKLNETSMLVGTQKGLYKYATNGNLTLFLNSELLISYKIETLAQDNFNYYVSIRGLGFYFIDKETLKINAIKYDLFKNQLVHSVFIEGDKKIWLCTSTGCYKFQYSEQKKQFELTNEFSIKNGLISGDVNRIVAHQGFYYVATSKGVFKIPLNFKIKRKVSNLFFERVISNGTTLLNRPSFITTIYPSKQNRILEVEFASSSFLKSDPAYRYRLIKDKKASEWNYTNSELIQLNNLTNGKYKLEVSNGASNIAVLNFSIPPLFKETIWYALLLIFGFICVTSAITYQIFRFQKTKRNLAESRLLTMQTKLNPHFIFNSLNSMQHILFEKDFETSNKYLTAFSDLMRKCFEFSDKEFISLDEELKFIEKYIGIEQMKRKFDFEISIASDMDLFTTQIPPLFLQPLIENCIKHGFRNIEKKCSINVAINLEKEAFKIVIRNNGILNNIEKFYKKDGSLDVLNKRIEHLKWIYKNNAFDLTFNVENGITKTTLILPCKINY